MWVADVVMAVLAPAMAVGVAAAAGRAGGSAKRVLAAIGVWLALTAFLATSGVFADWTAKPPRWPLLPIVAFIMIALVVRSGGAKQVLARVPRSWPIFAQTFRIGVELGLYALHAAGRAPAQLTFAGRNVDILVGLTAPLVGWLVASKRIGPKAAIAWNIAGLAVLANTVATVATSTPGPLHLDWGGAPFTAIAAWPIVWLPAFLMPLAVFLHVVSIRQNIAALRSEKEIV